MTDQTRLTSTPAVPLTIVRPPVGWSGLNLRDLWLYRELIYFLTWRDLKVRYKQTLLGASWAILRPFLTMVVFSIFFGRLAEVPSDGMPYPIFAFVALLPWELFSNALSVASRSLVSNSHMITKVYFPRIILPLSSTLSGLVDFLIAFVILIGMMVFYGVSPTSGIWTLPLFLLLALITALGVGLWLSALNVLYRDIGYITPFLVQFWLFISPVVYSTNLLTDQLGAQWEFLYALNPMVGVINGFRWALLGIETRAFGPGLAISVAVALVILVSGVFYFRRMERQFADMV
ncbi:MAG: ABC transporter permease [Anaerolineaceae bacterium]|jgi:lipopolysaccharide transport system permease protein